MDEELEQIYDEEDEDRIDHEIDDLELDN